MTKPECPPLNIDRDLAARVEEYRMAKAAAAIAIREGAAVEKAGHYDKDTPMQPRTAREVDAATTERAAAIKVADELLAWVDRHR